MKKKTIKQTYKQGNKDSKSKKQQIYYKNWWIACIYIFIPIFLMWCFDRVFFQMLRDFMLGIEIGDVIIFNSEYAIHKIISPFCRIFVLIIGFLISYIVLSKVGKELLKKRLYFPAAKQCLKWFECVAVLLALVIAVYSKVDSFEYDQYGISVSAIEETKSNQENRLYIPLEPILSIHSVGLEVENENLFYKLILEMSRGLFYISDNLELFIAIAGAVIFPLRNYAELIEQENITS